MDVEKLIRESIDLIKLKWKLPESGFLAGGSISNICWNKISNNNAPVNDLDIYILDKIIDKPSNEEFVQKQSYRQKDKVIYEDYTGLCVYYETSNFYLIDGVSVDGFLNTINYQSNTSDPMIIIESFDINCCQVGYDIKEDKIYWTKEFEYFLNSGELGLINLSSPAHSAMRLVKKRKELNAILPEIELDMISYCLFPIVDDVFSVSTNGLKNINRFTDSIKFRFKKRYADMFEEYKEYLDDRFKLVRDMELESRFPESEFWIIESRYQKINIESYAIGLSLSKDFIFYIRNIHNNEKLEKLWMSIKHIFDTSMGLSNYLDCEINNEDIDLLRRLVSYAPTSANNLKGLTLSKQIKIVKKIFGKFSNDPIIAISILEKSNIDSIDLDDDMSLLLLELSVRKEILEDTKNKVKNILYLEEIPNNQDRYRSEEF